MVFHNKIQIKLEDNDANLELISDIMNSQNKTYITNNIYFFIINSTYESKIIINFDDNLDNNEIEILDKLSRIGELRHV